MGEDYREDEGEDNREEGKRRTGNGLEKITGKIKEMITEKRGREEQGTGGRRLLGR